MDGRCKFGAGSLLGGRGPEAQRGSEYKLYQLPGPRHIVVQLVLGKSARPSDSAACTCILYVIASADVAFFIRERPGASQDGNGAYRDAEAVASRDAPVT
eukprot:1788406-Prymnesium_polylepis.2